MVRRIAPGILRYNIILIISLAIISLTAIQAICAERVVLFETFNNVDCLDCALLNKMLQKTVINNHGKAFVLAYHLWWYNDEDPFYLAAGDEARTRRSYYSNNFENIFITPWVNVNGTPLADQFMIHRSDYAFWQSKIDSALADQSDYFIDLQSVAEGDSFLVTATITPESAAVSQTLNAYFTVVETNVHFDNAPGSNRLQDFYGIVRRMLPDAHGEEITVGQSPVSLDYMVKTESRWDTSNIMFALFLQHPETHEILQVGFDRTHFIMASDSYQQITSTLNKAHYTITVKNCEKTEQNFLAYWSTSGLSDWISTLTFDDVSLANPDFFSIPAGTEKELSLDVTPTSAGYSTIAFSVQPEGEEHAAVTQHFTTTSSVPLLLVDDDGFFPYEDYYFSALENSGVSYGFWEQSLSQLNQSQLQNVESIIWWTGLSYPTLTQSDRDMLAGYLEGGHNLFITGQDIGYDLCDSSYAYFDTLSNSGEFYEDYFSAVYENDFIDNYSLQGTSSDPISSSLTIQISGSKGANNQFYPSVITPTAPAQKLFQYEENKAAALCYVNDAYDYKIVYFAFGFEAINNPNHRETILSNVLTWFDITTGSQENYFAAAETAPTSWVSHNYPNPFNARTSITFNVAQSADVVIQLYDILGRDVGTVVNERYPTGRNVVFFDAGDLPSGIYFCRSKIGDYRKVFKMSLLK